MMGKATRQLRVSVRDIEKIRKDVYRLSFCSAYLAKKSVPGNFLQVKISGTILRRPFSIHDISRTNIYILFRLRGRGTRILSQYKKGDPLDLIGPLGRGFCLKSQAGGLKIIVAGGIGVAPLVLLARRIKAERGSGNNLAILGFETKNDIVCEEEFRKLGFKTHIATEDGSKGKKGNVTRVLKEILSSSTYAGPVRIYACGPKGMFFEIKKIMEGRRGIECQVSFEQFMGCGLGVCCACAIETKNGYKKICQDGPVFDIREIW